jgi:transglutaminase-like putative cysteine protease
MMTGIARQRGAFTSDTLRLMRSLVDDWSKTAFMVEAARAIVDNVKATTFEQESLAIWQWIRRAITYRLDPVDTQWIQDPFETMTKTKSGNCANMAVLAGTLLQALGHPVSIQAIQWKGYEDFSHAIIFDKLTGLIVDPVNSSFDKYAKEVSSILEV